MYLLYVYLLHDMPIFPNAVIYQYVALKRIFHRLNATAFNMNFA